MTFPAITKAEFNEYVVNLYHGSSKPLNYMHLVKGCLLQFAVKMTLDMLKQLYVEATEVGKGADFYLAISPLIILIECKNEKYHTETEKSVRRDIISRFTDFSKETPKILVTSPVDYTREARRLLDEYNVQILELPSDFQTPSEAQTILNVLEAKLIRAIYKFRHYGRYPARFGTDRSKDEHRRGVAIAFVPLTVNIPSRASNTKTRAQQIVGCTCLSPQRNIGG